MSSAPIFEIRRIGPAAQVTAADPATLVEVSLQGPAGMPDSALKRLALAKLVRAIERQQTKKD